MGWGRGRPRCAATARSQATCASPWPAPPPSASTRSSCRSRWKQCWAPQTRRLRLPPSGRAWRRPRPTWRPLLALPPRRRPCGNASPRSPPTTAPATRAPRPGPPSPALRWVADAVAAAGLYVILEEGGGSAAADPAAWVDGWATVATSVAASPATGARLALRLLANPDAVGLEWVPPTTSLASGSPAARPSLRRLLLTGLDALARVAPSSLLLVPGGGQSSLLGGIQGSGFAVAQAALGAAWDGGAGTADGFLGELVLRPYASRVAISPSLYVPSGTKPLTGDSLWRALDASVGYLSARGYCWGSPPFTQSCRRFPIVPGDLGGPGMVGPAAAPLLADLGAWLRPDCGLPSCAAAGAGGHGPCAVVGLDRVVGGDWLTLLQPGVFNQWLHKLGHVRLAGGAGGQPLVRAQIDGARRVGRPSSHRHPRSRPSTLLLRPTRLLRPHPGGRRGRRHRGRWQWWWWWCRCLPSAQRVRWVSRRHRLQRRGRLRARPLDPGPHRGQGGGRAAGAGVGQPCAGWAGRGARRGARTVGRPVAVARPRGRRRLHRRLPPPEPAWPPPRSPSTTWRAKSRLTMVATRRLPRQRPSRRSLSPRPSHRRPPPPPRARPPAGGRCGQKPRRRPSRRARC